MIEFFVPGTPAPAGSKKAFVLKRGGAYTGRAIVTDDCKRSKPWQSEVKAVALNVWHWPVRKPDTLMTGPLRVTFTFRVRRPQGHFGSGKNAGVVKDSAPKYPAVKPDVLKLARCVEDALTNVIYADDAQIVQEIITKEYAAADQPTGVNIRIEEV